MDDDTSCAAPCALFAERRNADAAAEVQAQIVALECGVGNCRGVVSLNGACYALVSGMLGQTAHDCALEPAEIFAAYEAYLEAINTPPEPRGTPVEIETFFTPGSSGVITLRQGEVLWSGQTVLSAFGAHARFFDPIEARAPFREEVIDPLEGTDDCGVRSFLSGEQPTPSRQRNVQRAVLIDDGVERVLPESSYGLNYTYDLDLAAEGALPRFGGRYAFTASGGSFGGSIELPEILLPERLSLPLLESRGRFERGALELTWTGRGDVPLKLDLLIQSTLEEFSESYAITCLMQDDGAFTIPAAVLEAVPEGLGFVTASFEREHRELVETGERLISSIATVSVTHHFALAPACDNSAVMQACLASAESIQASYVACGAEPPALESLCPSYLSESCLSCPEYFECAARVIRCDEQGLSIGDGCICP